LKDNLRKVIGIRVRSKIFVQLSDAKIKPVVEIMKPANLTNYAAPTSF
jgi:hypothetical protein